MLDRPTAAVSQCRHRIKTNIRLPAPGGSALFTRRGRPRHHETNKKYRQRGATMKFLSGRPLAIAAAIAMSAFAMPAHAEIVVQIDKSSQRMAVSVDGSGRYNWPVS